MAFPRSTSALHTPPASPYTESLAIATASSSSSNGMNDTTGPKISSRATRIELTTSASTVGSTYQPFGRCGGRRPPAATRAPSSRAIWM